MKGQPAKPDSKKQHRRNVTLSDKHWEQAIALGNGNASEGIRKAVESYTKLRKRAKG